MHPSPRSSNRSAPLDRWSRRGLLGAAAAALLAASGCDGWQGGVPGGVATPVGSATPVGPVPGFEDPQRWAGRTLVVGAWGGEVQQALREAVWQPFARATGCRVEESATDVGRLATPTSSGRAYADLLLVDPFWAASPVAAPLLQPIDPAAIDPDVRGRFGGGARDVPAFAYAMVAAYRRPAVPKDAPPADWAAWWDASRFPGDRSLGRRPFGTIEAALLADGVAPAQLYPLDLERALAKLRQIVDAVGDRWWNEGFEPVSWLGNGRADFASAWHYRVIAGQRDGLDVDWVWDQGLLVADRWAIPAGARSPDIANDLIRYASAPRVQAALARAVPLGPVHPAAFAELDPFVLATLPTAPAQIDRLVPADAAWWAANRDEAARRLAAILPGPPPTPTR